MSMISTQISAVIIDDEVSARDALKKMIEKDCPAVNILGEADCVASGQALIRRVNPMLIFLDVEMPSGTGFELLNGLSQIESEVIFTTAHDQYALNAIKISALDYLLKPVNKQELIEAIAKVKNRDIKVPIEVWNLLKQQVTQKKEAIERLAIHSMHGFEIIKTNQILYCEGDRNYTTFYLTDKHTVVSSKTLKEYDRLLEASNFLRVHAKYLVNIEYVKKYQKGRGGSLIMADGKTIEVSQSKKNDLVKMLG